MTSQEIRRTALVFALEHAKLSDGGRSTDVVATANTFATYLDDPAPERNPPPVTRFLPTVVDIAVVCYEANRAYCLALGDASFGPWADAPQWQKDTNIAGVMFICGNPDAPPSASHESWLAQKKVDGWRYGPVKDPVKKEHPCFVPYEDLPVEQKAKDYIFGAIVRALT